MISASADYLIRRKEACQLLGNISTDTIRRRVARGEIFEIRPKGGGHPKYSFMQIMKLVRGESR